MFSACAPSEGPCSESVRVLRGRVVLCCEGGACSYIGSWGALILGNALKLGNFLCEKSKQPLFLFLKASSFFL